SFKGVPTMHGKANLTQKQIGRLTAGAIGAWFTFSVVMGITGKFKGSRDRPPLALGLTLVLPVLAFVSLYRTSNQFRAFCKSLDLKALTLPHAWRIVAFDFLRQRAKGRLPGGFAYPAAIGDILAGIGALGMFLAMRGGVSRLRGPFIALNAFGTLDLLN